MNVHQPDTQQGIIPVGCTIVNKVECRLWTTLSLCVCVGGVGEGMQKLPQ